MSLRFEAAAFTGCHLALADCATGEVMLAFRKR